MRRSDMPLKRERALKVPSAKLDVPAIQENMAASLAVTLLGHVFSSRVRSRCPLRPHSFFVEPPAEFILCSFLASRERVCARRPQISVSCPSPESTTIALLARICPVRPG